MMLSAEEFAGDVEAEMGPDGPSSRFDVLEEQLWRAEYELRGMLEAWEGSPRVDAHTGVITLASGARAFEDTGDAARITEELDTLRRAIRRQRRHVASLRAERRRLGDRWPMGLQEIGAELGYPASTVKQWRNRGLLPVPAGSVSGAPFWWRPTVLEWAKACGRDRKVSGASDAYDISVLLLFSGCSRQV